MDGEIEVNSIEKGEMKMKDQIDDGEVNLIGK